MGSDVSASGDVYSYGILLLEMFTGKKPTDDMFSGSLNLHNFTKMAFPERVAEVADPTLFQLEEESEAIHRIQECLTVIYRIGIECSVGSPRERADIGRAVAELLSIRDIFIGANW